MAAELDSNRIAIAASINTEANHALAQYNVGQ
jgi:hypothetical protein